MTDGLRDRIAAVQLAHMGDQYEQDMGECPCGFKYSTTPELAAHVADAVIRELPEPIKPTPPELEDLTSIPAQKHVWSRGWDADIHQGYFCTECEEMSDCELCKKDWDAGDDCLVVQADDRNRKAMRLFKKALERWEAQMDYWREMTGAADD